MRRLQPRDARCAGRVAGAAPAAALGVAEAAALARVLRRLGKRSDYGARSVPPLAPRQLEDTVRRAVTRTAAGALLTLGS